MTQRPVYAVEHCNDPSTFILCFLSHVSIFQFPSLIQSEPEACDESPRHEGGPHHLHHLRDCDGVQRAGHCGSHHRRHGHEQERIPRRSYLVLAAVLRQRPYLRPDEPTVSGRLLGATIEAGAFMEETQGLHVPMGST